jgi:hypothetical protein
LSGGSFRLVGIRRLSGWPKPDVHVLARNCWSIWLELTNPEKSRGELPVYRYILNILRKVG